MTNTPTEEWWKTRKMIFLDGKISVVTSKEGVEIIEGLIARVDAAEAENKRLKEALERRGEVIYGRDGD